ncbi:hypothetical protein QMK30_37690 [Streptomyces sp. H27-C3]|nr:MAB_1171c family putative transporter [Streptomyces sp. H27-C3]MDJ0467063.1 hypothetical protein [Streptomyces sp. H27-C3]
MRVLRTDRSVTQLALIANFAFLTIIYTVSTPTVWVATSETVGIVNFSGLFTQGCVILLTACEQIILLHLSHDRETAWRKARPRLACLAVVLGVMAVLFSAATSVHENPNDFAVTKAQFYPAYLIVYLTAYSVSQLDVGIMCWRYTKIAPSPWLRRGLYCIALTLPFVFIYSGSRYADVVAGQFGVSGHAWEPVAQWAVAIAAIIKTIGWTLPDWGPHLSRIWRRVDDRRAYRELAPVHVALTTQVPGPVLQLDATADLPTRLYRRMVEIRDAQWSLRPWMHPSVTISAAQLCDEVGLTGNDRAAVIEAAVLKAAVHTKVQGGSPSLSALGEMSRFGGLA